MIHIRTQFNQAKTQILTPQLASTLLTNCRQELEETAQESVNRDYHQGKEALGKILTEEQKAALEEADGATIATPSRDTVKLADEEGYAEATTDRSRTWLIQTPQAFYREELLALHRALGDGPERGRITDDCMLLERAGRRVKLVPGSCRNLKITTPEDRKLAEFYLKKEPTE